MQRNDKFHGIHETCGGTDLSDLQVLAVVEGNLSSTGNTLDDVTFEEFQGSPLIFHEQNTC